MTAGPRVVVWAGASYSWIWWADMLEALGWHDATFPTDACGLRAAFGIANLLLVGGGDVSATAEVLDRARARQWLEAGGAAVGTCAGAYAMRRWTGVRVLNAADEAPRGAPVNAWTRCAEGLVVHVARGPVRLGSTDGGPLSAHLYGGPVLDADPAQGARVLARYCGPAEGAEVLLPNRLPLIDGTPAVIGCAIGRGWLLLSGPHLEHPGCDDAHAWLAGLLGFGRAVPRTGPPTIDGSSHPTVALASGLRRVRRAAIAAGDRRWRSHERAWSAERVAAMTDAVLRRLAALRSWGWPFDARCATDALAGVARMPTDRSADDEWSALLSATSCAGARVMEAYFEALRGGMRAPGRRRPSRLRADAQSVGLTMSSSHSAPGVVRP